MPRLTARPALDGFDPARLEEATAAPHRYGFHATLKPPFALAPGRDRDSLIGRRACLRHVAPAGPPRQLAALGDFLALIPDGPAPAIDALAAANVEALDSFFEYTD